MKRLDLLLLTAVSLLGAFVAREAVVTRDGDARLEASFGATRVTNVTEAPEAAEATVTLAMIPSALPAMALPPTATDAMSLDEVKRRLEVSASGTYIADVIAARDSALARWPDRAGNPLRVWVQPASKLEAFDPAFVPMVREAFTDWTTSGIPLAFTFVRDSAAADIRVTWVDRFNEPISGKTLWAYDARWWIVDAQIQLALHQRSGTALDSASIQAIARHEVGHLIGLDHTRDTTSIMMPRVRVRELSASDRATAQLLYRLPPGRIGQGKSQAR